MHSMTILVARRITKSKEKIFTLKTLCWLIISILPCFINYKEGYDAITTFILSLSLILALKKIFGIDILTSLVISLYTMVLSIIPDLICGTIISNFMSFEDLRSNVVMLSLTNIIISLGTYFLFYIPFIEKFTKLSIQQTQKPQNRRIIIFILLAFIAICTVYFILYISKIPTEDYVITSIVVLVFIFLIFIYMSEIIRYDKLKVKNDVLYECMENIENYQEKQDLKIHEYKNQLSKVASMTKEKEVLKKLEEILEIDLNPDNYILGQLKYIPKGEIKSLIYYKLLVASKKNLNILIDVSPKLTKKNFKLTEKENIELSQLIGIYFDNAIEAASKSKKKNISLEVYLIKGELTITIMNTFKGTVDLDNIEKKGFSTKGVERGKGLYFAKKIVKNSTSFETKNELTKDGKYYIQKITVKKS